MPFGVANAPALFQGLMNKFLYILRRRPLVQELVSRWVEMEAHIDDVSLGTNTQDDHILLLQEIFTVCQENHLLIKEEKCEFMREAMDYLGFDVGYGRWKPAASKMQHGRTGRYVTTLRRVSTTSGFLLRPAIFIGAIYTILRNHQLP